MEKNEKSKYEPTYSLKAPIIEYSIGGVLLISWIVLVFIVGFTYLYLLIAHPYIF